jgi:hypothetical protein
LSETERLFKAGKATAEDVFDAKSDLEIVTRNVAFSRPDREKELRAAQSRLELAEQLEAKYLGAPPVPPKNPNPQGNRYQPFALDQKP